MRLPMTLAARMPNRIDGVGFKLTGVFQIKYDSRREEQGAWATCSVVINMEDYSCL